MGGSPTAGGDLWLIGAALGVFASLSGTAGKQLLRFSEVQRLRGASVTGRMAYALGIFLNTTVGPLIDMGSYAFAPQSVIAPLSALDVVWNTVSAPCTLGETVTPMLAGGCAVISGGALATSLFGPREEAEYSAESIKETVFRPTVAFYLMGFAGWLAFNITVLMPRSAAPKGEPWATGDPLRGLSLGMTAGSIAGNMFCVKAFVEVLQSSILDGFGDEWADWTPYVLLVGAVFFAVSNLFFLTKAMREYEALFMGAVFEGSLIASACVSGIVVFSELGNLEVWQIICYWMGVFSILGGIYIVALGAMRQKDPVSPVLPCLEDGTSISPVRDQGRTSPISIDVSAATIDGPLKTTPSTPCRLPRCAWPSPAGGATKTSISALSTSALSTHTMTPTFTELRDAVAGTPFRCGVPIMASPTGVQEIFAPRSPWSHDPFQLAPPQLVSVDVDEGAAEQSTRPANDADDGVCTLCEEGL